MKKYLSIGIGCHPTRQKDYFYHTLDSIIALLEKNELDKCSQIIVCNDSKDITHQLIIAKKYKEKYPKLFRIINNHENYGIQYTYQKMLLSAKGQFFMPFDSDDIINDFDIITSLNYLHQHKEYAGSYGVKRLFTDEKQNLGDTGGRSDLFNFGFYCNHNAMILKTKDAIQAGGYCPQFLTEKVHVACDIVMWIAMYLYKDLKFENQIRVYGRQHKNSYSVVKSQLYTKEFQLMQNCLINYYRERYTRASDNLIIIAQGLLKNSYNQDEIKRLFFETATKRALFSKYLFPYYMQFLMRKGYVPQAVSTLLYGSLYNSELKTQIAQYISQNHFISKTLHNFNNLIQIEDKIKMVSLQQDEWFNKFF